MSEIRFDGEVVIVTGAAGGLGRSQAVELARRGARVVVNDLGGSPAGGGADAALAAAVVEEIGASGGEAAACTESISSKHGPRQVIAAALDTWGRLDAIVTNAGILRNRLVEDLTEADWDDLMDVNLRGTFRVVQESYRVMKGAGGGRIVTMTSLNGLCGAFGQSNYAASKLGIVGLTKSVAWEGSQFGIKANCVAPAAFDTRMVEIFTPDDAAFSGRPAELTVDTGFAYAPLLTSSRVTPLVVTLLHQSCRSTGQIFGASGGHFARFWISQSEGYVSGLTPTAEDVAEHWDDLCGTGQQGIEVTDESLIWSAKVNSDKLAGLSEIHET